jgi:NAD-dependent SIR2 family protein deacetylase
MSDEVRSGAALATMVCKKCGEEKPETEFYMQTRDGYRPARMTVCKACHKARVVKNTRKARQAGRGRDKPGRANQP